MNFLEFIKNNLSHVLPILIAGAVAIAIIVERTRALFVVYPVKDTKAFLEQVKTLVLSGRSRDALALCEQHSGKPLTRIVRTGIQRAHLPEQSIESGIEIELGDATHSIQKRTSFLATIANVTTLLGLFGTIAGLISSFEAVGSADPQQKSALLAAGISTAMNATMLGLAVAIPCMVAFSWLVNRQNGLVSELEDSAVRMMDILRMRHFADEQNQDEQNNRGAA